MKKIVVKVTIIREKCKTVILESVAKLDGIQSLNLDEEKGTLTVVGNVDPVSIINSLKKKKMAAQIESVGPPEEKKPDEEECKKACEKMIECCRRPCSRMPFGWYPHRPVI
ncbi:hypothetical protein LUZ63_014726 [Rhynchospora breviuscula]|uniref:HMA domain-containing protein n=1 Tax=Rhynchospora breviuscula TaxID=2022672 RepID=A0A9Q0CAX6_9POAL|nr:hypothetical protein LUZ63_014726 [Rhynchospora breviuscula]